MATRLGVDASIWAWSAEDQNGTRSGPETCDYFKSIEVELHLGNGILGFDGAGTFDDLMVEFGKDYQVLLVHPARGEKVTKYIDLEKAFNSTTVSVDTVKSFRIYSVEDQRVNPDSWEIGGITITATCAESSRKVVIKKFSEEYEWYNRFGAITGDFPTKFEGSIDIGDWKWEHPDGKTDTIAVMPLGQPNACTKFKSLEAHLELGTGISALTAGTNDDLILDFSGEMFSESKRLTVLATSPSHGDVIDKPIDLKTVFGKSVVSAQDVHHVQLSSREGASKVADPWKVATFELRAQCEGSPKSVVVTKWRNLNQWFDRFDGTPSLSGDLSLQDWHWA